MAVSKIFSSASTSKDCTQISRIELRSLLAGGEGNSMETSVRSLLLPWLDEVVDWGELHVVWDELSILFSSIMKHDNSSVIFLFKPTEDDPEGINMNGKVLLLIFFLLVNTTTWDITCSVNGTLGVLTTSKFCTSINYDHMINHTRPWVVNQPSKSLTWWHSSFFSIPR